MYGMIRMIVEKKKSDDEGTKNASFEPWQTVLAPEDSSLVTCDLCDKVAISCLAWRLGEAWNLAQSEDEKTPGCW